MPEVNFDDLMATRPRVTVTLSEDVYQILSDWASQEERTLANLLAYIAAKAAKERVEQKKESP
ncbi:MULTISPECIES: ribbon-helix-helix domain-containing protein [Floridanema]|nr:hypothetical protein [Phormidium ambiguum]